MATQTKWRVEVWRDDVARLYQAKEAIRQARLQTGDSSEVSWPDTVKELLDAFAARQRNEGREAPA